MAFDAYGHPMSIDAQWEEVVRRQDERIAAGLAQLAAFKLASESSEAGSEPTAPDVPPEPATASPVERTDNVPAPRASSPPPRAAHGPAPSPRPRGVIRTPDIERQPDPVADLAAALDAAASDAERAQLLASAPKSVRGQLQALFVYRQFVKVESDEYDILEGALDAAATDADRAGLIAGRTPTFLVEWAWRQRAGDEGWRRRYLALTTTEGGES